MRFSACLAYSLLASLTVAQEYEGKYFAELVEFNLKWRAQGCGSFVDAGLHNTCAVDEKSALEAHWKHITGSYTSETECAKGNIYTTLECNFIWVFVESCTCEVLTCGATNRHLYLADYQTEEDREKCSEYLKEWCGYQARYQNEGCEESLLPNVKKISGLEDVAYETCFPCSACGVQVSVALIALLAAVATWWH
eukprot:GHVN01027124.1.p1 GENE.GHVN01027124.1~~GHVN01027124.1.p1  ORF type:complete len:195 (-),score=0.34 GHVN01027124.1:210-794(-)